jgi:hypothetical protein
VRSCAIICLLSEDVESFLTLHVSVNTSFLYDAAAVPSVSLAFCMTYLTFDFQSFVLTFLAEWGDRSQIATIAVRFNSPSSNWIFQLSFLLIQLHNRTRSMVVLNAAGDPQERGRSRYGSDLGAHHLHVDRGGGRQHAGLQDISGHGCHRRRPPLPWVLSFVVFLPAIVVPPCHASPLFVSWPASSLIQ